MNNNKLVSIIIPARNEREHNQTSGKYKATNV